MSISGIHLEKCALCIYFSNLLKVLSYNYEPANGISYSIDQLQKLRSEPVQSYQVFGRFYGLIRACISDSFNCSQCCCPL